MPAGRGIGAVPAQGMGGQRGFPGGGAAMPGQYGPRMGIPQGQGVASMPGVGSSSGMHGALQGSAAGMNPMVGGGHRGGNVGGIVGPRPAAGAGVAPAPTGAIGQRGVLGGGPVHVRAMPTGPRSLSMPQTMGGVVGSSGVPVGVSSGAPTNPMGPLGPNSGGAVDGDFMNAMAKGGLGRLADGSSAGDLAGATVNTVDPSEFPALGSRSVSAPGGGVAPPGLLPQVDRNTSFTQDDFPALPGAKAGAAGATDPDPAKIGGSQQISSIASIPQAALQGGSLAKARTNVPDQFGMIGLLGMIRGSSEGGSGSALGVDLTAFGLNMNSPDVLYDSFSSPWGEGGRPAADVSMPSSFRMQPRPLNAAQVGKLADGSLLYMFYMLHRDPVLNVVYPRERVMKLAAQDLYGRGWRFSRERNVWITRSGQGAGQPEELRYFDPTAWESRRVPPEWIQGLSEAQNPAPMQSAPS